MYLLKIYVLYILVDINIGGVEMFTQRQCYYKRDGDVAYCQNITELAMSPLTGSLTVYSYDGIHTNYYNVTVSAIRSLYQHCLYDMSNGRIDECLFLVVFHADTQYRRWCKYNLQRLHSRPVHCQTAAASTLCLLTQPSTKRLLHQTIPPPVYITGLIFNILIILVLHFKADKSVLNLLLLMLSVWDLLYLGCLLLESFIGHYAHNTQIQISDTSYAWLDVRCELGDSSVCDVSKQWWRADDNISISTVHYPIMYWLHVAALVFQIASVYQTTVIATFRCIAIRQPFQASQMLTSTTAAVATGSCLLLGVTVHVPAFIAGDVITSFVNCKLKYMLQINTYKECLSNISATTQNPLYSASTSTFMNLHHYYHVITYSIILFLALPFLLLLVLNILMLAELYRGSGASHDNENKAVTKVVAAIVTVFLITYIIKPLYIVDIYYFSGYIMNTIAFQSCGGYFTVSLLITVVPALNSVINLLLYLGLRQTFRQQFTSMFLFCKQDANPRRPEAIALQPIHK